MSLSLATPGTEACDAGGGAFRPQWREWPGPELPGESRDNGILANAAAPPFVLLPTRGELSRKSIKNLFGIVRAIYSFQFDEMAQSGKPIVSPWLVKWKKVAPPKTVQRELPNFPVAQMAAIVNAAKTQLNRALFALAADAGARARELFALRLD